MQKKRDSTESPAGKPAPKMPRTSTEDPPDSGGATASGTSHVPEDARGVILPERQSEEEEDEDDVYLQLLQNLQESRSEEVHNHEISAGDPIGDPADTSQDELVLSLR